MRAAIIPARGGSKRVPRKNVAEIGGRPMLAHPICCAIESGLFDAVYVSTEDAEIAEVARQWNASLIERSPEIAQDRSTVVQVCLHALDEMERRKRPVDLFCCIYATAIFIEPDDLRNSLAMIEDEPECDVVMGVSEYDIHPVKALKREGGYWTRMWPEYGRMQSQFYPNLVASNGTFYWARTETFRADPTFYAKRLKCYEIPRSRAVDIDTLDDLKFACHLMATRQALNSP